MKPRARGRPPGSRNKPIARAAPRLDVSEVIKARLPYMRNCLVWLEWYTVGTATEERTLEILTAIRTHCNDIESKIKNGTNSTNENQ